jgi:FHS family L-fucose permease-like MFS transporter
MNPNKSSLYSLVSIFFFFGFVAASNSILIPTFKGFFNISQLEAQLVDLAFYLAYFVGSLVYLIYSQTQGDWLNKVGYKKGLILGLSISTIGAILFIPASLVANFHLFLVALFIIGFGFSLQQIVLNPFLLAMGTPETGNNRINTSVIPSSRR